MVMIWTLCLTLFKYIPSRTFQLGMETQSLTYLWSFFKKILCSLAFSSSFIFPTINNCNKAPWLSIVINLM